MPTPSVFDPVVQKRIPLSKAVTQMTPEWMDDNLSRQTGIDLLEIASSQAGQIDELKHACLAALGFIQGQSVLNKVAVTELLVSTLKPFVNRTNT